MNQHSVFAACVCVVGLLTIALPAFSQVTDFHVVEVDNSGGGAGLDGFVTNSLQIDFDGTLARLQLLLDLDTGSVYRDAFTIDFGRPPNAFPPNPSFFTFAPSLEFDSYSGNTFGNVALSAGSVDLGASPTPAWPATTTAAPITLNQSWTTFGHAHHATGFETYRLKPVQRRERNVQLPPPGQRPNLPQQRRDQRRRGHRARARHCFAPRPCRRARNRRPAETRRVK